MSVRNTIVWILIAGISAILAYVMLNGVGLSDSLDFGAGAYYYADIPEFDRFGSTATDFSGSSLAVVAFFAVWSLVILGLLVLVRSIPKPADGDSETAAADDSI